MPDLPTNIDATYSDDPGDPSVKAHQQAHDVLHAWANAQPEATAAAGHTHANLATAVRGFLATAQSVPDAATTVLALDGEGEDTDGFHDTAANNSRLTVPAGLGGVYLLLGTVGFAFNATGVRQARIHLNGALHVVVSVNAVTATGFPTRVGVSGMASLTEGDFVELAAFQSSGVALDVEATWSQLSAIRIGG